MLTALPLSVCGITLLGYYPFEEIVEFDLNGDSVRSVKNLSTIIFICSSTLMILPSLKAFNELMISQQMLIAVCFQLLAVFAKVFRVVPSIHQCLIESVLIGFSFPFILGAIQNTVFRWFPKYERTFAFSIACMPVALGTVLKFSLVVFPSHQPDEIRPNDKEIDRVENSISKIEIVESLIICIFALLAVIYIQDRPHVYPSFMAMQPRENVETQWAAVSSHRVWWAMLTFAFIEAAVFAGEFQHERNLQFAFGFILGAVFSFKFARHVETT